MYKFNGHHTRALQKAFMVTGGSWGGGEVFDIPFSFLLKMLPALGSILAVIISERKKQKSLAFMEGPGNPD